ncbi:uncharacterized protein YeeX (DUF496 family) [Sedimentibacter acidaminivorans]|uniref:Uncharacterized protein YeeX (DUF496 family) n=1 Tax=Sedimentibacter acidaminivorans TaxID=913099 RepID=A0ABS4GHV8_9FIRM|nr:hypothetical protein [Sedimentibacter acidaminivorans]MBP1927277.1 uncharacterized protein YeeX (DUF496 family) [Sedimentibacter acidaminivorans]
MINYITCYNTHNNVLIINRIIRCNAKLSNILRRISQFNYDDEHEEIIKVVTQAAKEYNCSLEDIQLKGCEYSNEILW